MGERQLDVDVIRNKLDAIDRARTALEGLGEVQATQLEEDPIVAAAVERLLCRMVELAVETNTHISAVELRRSPGDYRESFDFAHEVGVLEVDLVERIKPSAWLRPYLSILFNRWVDNPGL